MLPCASCRASQTEFFLFILSDNRERFRGLEIETDVISYEREKLIKQNKKMTRRYAKGHSPLVP